MLAKIRRHHDQLHNELTFNIRDDSIYHILSTSILPKMLHASHWWHLAFHNITNLNHRFAVMFIHIAYHHYVVNIHFERVQSSLESCTTSKFTDRSIQLHTKWSGVHCLCPYDVTCNTTFTTIDEYHIQLHGFPHA